MLLVFAVFFLYLFLAWRKPDFMFWLGITLFLDPGGFLFNYVNRSMIGGLQLTDVTFILLMLPVFSPRSNIKAFFSLRDNRWIFNFLLFFALFYHILIFGLVAPGYNKQAFFDNLQYRRLDIWGFLVVIPAYVFFRRSYHLMIKFAVITSAVLITLYLIRLITGLPVLPLWTGERGLGIEALRISMYRYGFAYWFIYVSVINYLFRLKLSKGNLIYFLGLVMGIAVILTLTRRSILLLIFSLFLLYVFSQRIQYQKLTSWIMLRMIFIFGIFFIALVLVSPKYLDNTVKMMGNTFEVNSSAENEFIQTDGRLQNDIPGHMSRFRQSPLIGYGYDALWYSNDVSEGGLSANDVPLTAALGMFGILGVGLFSLFYVRILKIIYKSYLILRNLYKMGSIHQNSILFVILFSLGINFLASYTLSFMSLFSDLVIGSVRVTNMIYVGFLLAAKDMLLLHNRILPVTSNQKNRIERTLSLHNNT